jgi:hypothetical protein
MFVIMGETYNRRFALGWFLRFWSAGGAASYTLAQTTVRAISIGGRSRLLQPPQSPARCGDLNIHHGDHLDRAYHASMFRKKRNTGFTFASCG